MFSLEEISFCHHTNGFNRIFKLKNHKRDEGNKEDPGDSCLARVYGEDSWFMRRGL